ncbi:hypothetical protein [Brevibacillus nitrificans]|uniref:hypothetical protein n=1 Tax=Brevibacillus nitrificans TaxID=651560 RepID=UPI002604BFBC|nr:hypothetical protein [Brevibacillus nitrificans]
MVTLIIRSRLSLVNARIRAAHGIAPVLYEALWFRLIIPKRLAGIRNDLPLFLSYAAEVNHLQIVYKFV